MEDEEFRRGAIEIQWLERRLPALVGAVPPDEGVRAAAIAAALLAHRDRTGRATPAPNGKPGEVDTTHRRPVARDAWKETARREGISDRW